MWSRRALSSALVVAAASAASAQQPAGPFGERLARAAEAQVGVTTRYDASYVRITFPGGDVPADRGVCSDVVVRAYRALGVDLQAAVHADMRRAFAAYPKTWGLTRPDPNIDHRRVPNLETFLRRRGAKLAGAPAGAALQPGDLVSWRLTGSNLPHIAVASTRRAPGAARPLMVHNIGAGTVFEDVLHSWPIVGWFRFHPPYAG